MAAFEGSYGIDHTDADGSSGGFSLADSQVAQASDALGPVADPTTHKTTIQAAYQITRDNYDWGTSIGIAVGPISFGFRTVEPGYTSVGEDVQGTFTRFTATEQAAARAALHLWADVANITFTDLGNTNAATIEFGNYTSATDQSEAFAYYPSSDDRIAGGSDGDVFFNTRYYSTTSADPGSYEFMTAIHEIGHTLGLEHPDDYNAGPGQDITYANSAQYVEDDRQYTLMSYFDETNTGAQFFVYDETPMMDDIAAIQRLYGANMTTRTGDTTYGFHSNAGSPYLISGPDQSVVYCVWDAGGTDTFDFSGYAQNGKISLMQESFSSVGGQTYNVSIPRGVTIENAIGGSGGDQIIGNAAANQLHGLSGNDTLDGGFGADTLIGGIGNDIFRVDNARDSIWEATGQGTDTVFASVSYALGAGQSVEWLATSLASGTDAINLTGNALAQHINGNAGANVLNDGGGGGADTMTGFGGGDVYRVTDAADQVIEAIAAQGSDTVFASVSYALGTGQSVEWLATSALSGTTALNLTGNELGQTIYGNNGVNGLLGGGGSDTIFGEGGADVIGGGLGRDIIDPGAGADLLKYLGVSDSTGVTRDLVLNLNLAGVDRFDFPVVPTAIRTEVVHGGLNTVHFDANLAAAIGVTQLGPHEAVLFDPDAGDLNLAGHVFLIVDANGVAGYQAGQDYVVELQGATGTLTLSDFT